MNSLPSSPWHIAAKSHAGMSGKNNEDRYAVCLYPPTTGRPQPSVLAIVSDGIGGHRAGEVAAEMAVQMISQAVQNGEAHSPTQVLRTAIIQASQAIYQKSTEDPTQQGMGATCACAWIIGDRLHIAYVGDSRIYLLRDNAVQQLSIDHTWIQEALDQGLLTIEQARQHPNAHVIRRYLGSRQEVLPDLRLRLDIREDDEQAEAHQGYRLQSGDRLLLCSDGLTDLVNEADILTRLHSLSPEEAAEQLIDLANQRGGHDNITVIILQMLPAMTRPVHVTPKPVRSTGLRLRWQWILVGTMIGVLAFIGGLGGGAYLLRNLNKTPAAPTAIPTSLPIQSPHNPTPAPAFSVHTPTPSLTPLPTLDQTPRSVAPTSTLTPWPTNTLSP